MSETRAAQGASARGPVLACHEFHDVGIDDDKQVVSDGQAVQLISDCTVSPRGPVQDTATSSRHGMLLRSWLSADKIK